MYPSISQTLDFHHPVLGDLDKLLYSYLTPSTLSTLSLNSSHASSTDRVSSASKSEILPTNTGPSTHTSTHTATGPQRFAELFFSLQLLENHIQDRVNENFLPFVKAMNLSQMHQELVGRLLTEDQVQQKQLTKLGLTEDADDPYVELSAKMRMHRTQKFDQVMEQCHSQIEKQCEQRYMVQFATKYKDLLTFLLEHIYFIGFDTVDIHRLCYLPLTDGLLLSHMGLLFLIDRYSIDVSRYILETFAKELITILHFERSSSPDEKDTVSKTRNKLKLDTFFPFVQKGQQEALVTLIPYSVLRDWRQILKLDHMELQTFQSTFIGYKNKDMKVIQSESQKTSEGQEARDGIQSEVHNEAQNEAQNEDQKGLDKTHQDTQVDVHVDEPEDSYLDHVKDMRVASLSEIQEEAQRASSIALLNTIVSDVSLCVFPLPLPKEILDQLDVKIFSSFVCPQGQKRFRAWNEQEMTHMGDRYKVRIKFPVESFWTQVSRMVNIPLSFLTSNLAKPFIPDILFLNGYENSPTYEQVLDKSKNAGDSKDVKSMTSTIDPSSTSIVSQRKTFQHDIKLKTHQMRWLDIRKSILSVLKNKSKDTGKEKDQDEMEIDGSDDSFINEDGQGSLDISSRIWMINMSRRDVGETVHALKLLMSE